MDECDLKQYLAAQKRIVDEALKTYLPPPQGLQKTVIEAVHYSVFAGGKRLRPILCMAAAEIVGGTRQSVLPAACAVEMIHTYSLIHDDLPAMDDDDYRRGKLTSHKVYGEAMAILAGDALLTEAFHLLTRLSSDHGGSHAPTTVLRIVEILSRASGYQGMIGGQVIDLESENRDVDMATVEEMHRRKTGALLTAAVEMGAVLGGGSAEQVNLLGRFGHHFGLVFQITDDLLDIEGDAEIMGKQPGSDMAKNKKTYPSLIGLEASREAARRHVDAALATLQGFDGKADPLRAITEYLLVRRA